MSRISQSAGDCAVEVYTDGSSLWPQITLVAANGEKHVVRGDLAQLHDLRYCIDRVLAQLSVRRRDGEA